MLIFWWEKKREKKNWTKEVKNIAGVSSTGAKNCNKSQELEIENVSLRR